MKYRWKVSPEPTGRYRSFEKRSWPTAWYANGEIAASISCDDDYRPVDAREGKHGPLTVAVADHSEEKWKWRRMKQRFSTLTEARDGFAKLLNIMPHLAPKEAQ